MIQYIPLLFILFFTACFDSANDTNTSNQSKKIRQEIENNINVEFTKWLKNGRVNAEVIPSALKVETLSDSSARNLRQRGMQREIPSSFSLHDVNGDGNYDDSFMTPVRDQGQCGVCWVFASIGALEGSYGAQSRVDFSEDQMKHTHGFVNDPSSAACSGGNIPMIIGYMSSFRGLINETLDPYNDDKNSLYCPTCAPSKYVDNIILVPARRNIQDNDTIKDILFNQKKPLYASVQVGFGTAGESGASNFDPSTSSFLITQPNATANHAIVIVGWDDTYRAQGKVGAFIVKNSWGSGSGDGGYYYFPYADTTIGFGELAYFEDIKDEAFIFQKLYSYDEYGAVLSFEQSGDVEIANKYTASEDEDIVGVSYFIRDSGTNVEVEIHKVISTNPLVSEKIDETNFHQENKLRGYYTAQFEKPVSVKAGESFLAVVKMSHPSGSVGLLVEGAVNGFSPHASANGGESFFKTTSDWQDLTTMRSDLNFPIKAMSVVSNNEELNASLHVKVDKEKVEQDEVVAFSVELTPSSLEISNVEWDFADGSTSSVTETQHAFSAVGKYDVKVSVTDKSGHTHSQKVSINVVKENLNTIEDSEFSFFENAQEGDVLGVLNKNYSGGVTISLSGVGHENFYVNSSGALIVNANASFDFESKSFYNLEATPINGGGVDTRSSVTLHVLNVDEFKPTLANFDATIAENAPDATVVGSINIVSSGDSSISAMVLEGSGSENFDISLGGSITLANGASLDFESTQLYSLHVKATNNAGESDANVSIHILNVAETYAEINPLHVSVVENAQPQSVVASLVVHSGDTPTQAIVLEGAGSEDFSVDTEGKISVAEGATINFEDQSEYNLSVRAINGLGASESVALSIQVNNSAEVVPQLADFEKILFENSDVGVLVGTVNIINAGDTPISSIVLSGNGASDFIISNDGNISVRTKLNFDRQNLYNLSAKATNAAGVSDISSVRIVLKEANPLVTAKFKAEDPTAGDRFSTALSSSNDRIVVGAKDKADGGAVYLFKQNANQSYTQVSKILPSDIDAGDNFGADVSMDGVLIAIGAPKDDDNGTDAGAVYVYRYNSSDDSTTQLNKIIGSDTVFGDRFGSSVYVKGSTILVGALEHNAKGAVYLFTYNSNDGSITQKAKFSPALANDGDGFGSDIVMDGSNIIVGSNFAEAGYLFDYSANDSVEEAYTFRASSGVNSGDLFGSKVDANNGIIVFGSPGNDSAYIFKYNSNTTTPLVKKVTINASGSGVEFGSDVSLNERVIAIGSKNSDSIYLYKYNADTFNISDEATHFVVNFAGVGSGVGGSIDIDQNILAIGAPNEDLEAENSGALFVTNLAVDNRPFLINYTPKIEVDENSEVVFRALYSSLNGTFMHFTLSGVDKDAFSIDALGVLRATSLDFENPTDVGSNNVYNISLTLEDSEHMTFVYDIEIKVLNVND